MMLTVTEELWITAVTTVPKRTSKRGFVREANIPTTVGSSLSPDIALDIPDSPIKRTPNPKTISPIFFTILFLTNITVRTPPSRKTGATSDKLKETSWEVTVVPIFAPRITPAA